MNKLILLLPVLSIINTYNRATIYEDIKYGLRKLTDFGINSLKNEDKLEILEKSLQSAPSAGSNIQEAATIISSNSDQIASSIETGAKNIGGSIEKAGSQVGDSCKMVGNIVGGIAIVKGGYDFACWSKTTFFPSEEEKTAKEKVITDLKKFRAEKDLNECLVKNSHRFKNRDGLPVDCATTAQIFSQLAGVKAYNEIKEEYRKYINGK
jgi:hypothetical protein